jgi:hypothetical protein
LKPEIHRDELLFEHRFWLQILGDHSRFILNSLSPEEEKEIEKAREFIGIFDGLLETARRDLKGAELMDLTEQAYSRAQELRMFKLHLLRRHLAGKLKIELPPTFFNHMLNELEEYLSVLCSIMSDTVPVKHPIHHHLLWLLDGAGHAISIEDSLDDVERDLKQKSKNFNRDFCHLHMKALEMAGYLRTGLMDFPSLNRLNNQAESKMKLFMDFLKEIEGMVVSKKALSTLMPLIPEHMYREECYYLTKLSEVSEIKALDCDPAKPRLEM